MSSDRIAIWLRDILTNIDDIAEHIGDADEVTFAGSKLVRDAVERCLERISEAVSRISRSGFPLESLEPAIPWPDIRGIGNRLRHAYDAVESEFIWTIVERDLEPLAKAVSRLLTDGRANQF